MATVVTIAVGVAGAAAVAVSVTQARRATVRARIEGSRGPVLLPRRIRVRVAVALRAAALDVRPEEAVAAWALLVAIAAVLGLALGAVPATVLVLGAIASGPLAIAAARRRAERAIAAALPAVLDGVARELRSGGTVAGALVRASEGRDALAADLARVVARSRLGAGLPVALARWPSERDLPGVRAAAGALAVAARTGGAAASALEGLAVSARDAIAVGAEARAQAAQARASAVVVGAAPLAYLCFTAVVDPGSVDVLVATPLGRTCLVLGLALEAVGVWWMRRVLRGSG